ncbi:integrin alpha-2-like [Takifugu flavidus]|uniref:integrin alpha-2-like n=1 Tax=Takifugu flavidus TaxID=433684 RepID=UPI002544A1AA|nr:integrin alpha-2-like [Takifugu flavidus]
MTTKGGNELLYVTRLDTDGGSVSCDSSSLVDPLKLSTKSHTQTFSPENLRQTDKLDCKSVKCKYIKCILKDIEVNSNYFVKVKTRIWIGTFITATYQSTELTPSISVETTNPDLLLINPKPPSRVILMSQFWSWWYRNLLY